MGDDEYDEIELAQAAYQAYGETTGFLNYQGKAMPGWDDLGDTIQGAWVAAARRVEEILCGPQALDELNPGLTD